MMQIKIQKIEVQLIILTDDVVEFSVNGETLGNIILKKDDEETTIHLHGGYVFGKFHCPDCAIKAIADLYCLLSEARKKSEHDLSKIKNEIMSYVIRH
jgi:hypothetical protein